MVWMVKSLYCHCKQKEIIRRKIGIDITIIRNGKYYTGIKQKDLDKMELELG